MQRKASAVWKGGLKDGNGTISAPGGVLNNTPYSFTMRFENAPGTNPEELIAAAHASCFSMALSAQLGEAKLTPESISTTVTVVEMLSGVSFASPNCADRAIEKQPACAAAISSSGFVPGAFSNRVVNEYWVLFRTPPGAEIVPLPSLSPPFQTALALRCMLFSS